MSTDSISYHCFVKVCSKDASGFCSDPYSADSNPYSAYCINRYDYWPRKQHEFIDETSQSAFDESTIVEVTKQITIPSVAAKNCRKTLGDVCIYNENVNVNSSAGEFFIASGLIYFLTLSNFLL